MKAKTVKRLFAAWCAFAVMLCIAPIASAAEEEITHADITVTKPVGGAMPELSTVSSDHTKYYADVYRWDRMAYGTATPSDGVPFETHARYDLRVIFHAKTGYTFAEDCVFTINGEKTGCYSQDSNAFRHIYLYAADPNQPTYTVTFEKNDGSNITDTVSDVFDTYTLPSCMFSAPAGRYFAGWLVGDYSEDPDDTVTVLGNTTVKALWKDIPASGYTVTFQANGATGSMQQLTDRYGEFTLPACDFIPPSGKRFAGWSIWPGNYGIEPAGRKIILWKDTSLTAVWKDIPQGRNVIQSVTCDISEPIADELSVAGSISATDKYTVSIGWSTTKDADALNDFNNKRFEAGKTYYADIHLVAKDPYIFADGATVRVNGQPYTAAWTVGASYKKYLSVYDIPFVVPSRNPSHTHSASGWRITQAYHYKVCTSCGDFLEQQDHTGGVATCSQKGECSVCGFAYIEENEEHRPDTSKWTACGNLYHAYLCIDCGAHCDPQSHQAGPAGTPEAAVLCKDCGYIITPAKGHRHNLTRIAAMNATCIHAGNAEYYMCDGCSELFADEEGQQTLADVVVAPIGHTISDDWRYDANNHWRICSVCNELLAETQMAHDAENGRCLTCNCVLSDPPALNNEKDDGIDLLWLWIVIGSVVVGASAALFVTKKVKTKER